MNGVLIVLEKYFKSKKEWTDYLDKTYNPVDFERSFYNFLEQLYGSPKITKSQSKEKG